MIEPKLLKIEAIDEPVDVEALKTETTIAAPSTRKPLRALFRRQKPDTHAVHRADGVQL